MDFGGLIQRSFNLAWRYKSLWIFGLFANGGAGTFNFELPEKLADRFDIKDFILGDGFAADMVEQFMAPLIVAGLIMGLAIFVCSMIAVPALIDGVNKVTRGGYYRFGESFSRGIDFFWRFLGLTLLAVVLIMGAIIIMVILALALTPLSLLLTIPAMIVFAFIVYHTFELAQVAMVARDISIVDALDEGWQLLRQNIGNCLIMSLLLIGLGIAVFIVIAIISLFTFVPLNIFLATTVDSLATFIVLAVILGLPVTLILGGYFGTVFNAMYIQFYFGLVEPAGVPAAVLSPDPDPDTPQN